MDLDSPYRLCFISDIHGAIQSRNLTGPLSSLQFGCPSFILSKVNVCGVVINVGDVEDEGGFSAVIGKDEAVKAVYSDDMLILSI